MKKALKIGIMGMIGFMLFVYVTIVREVKSDE